MLGTDVLVAVVDFEAGIVSSLVRDADDSAAVVHRPFLIDLLTDYGMQPRKGFESGDLVFVLNQWNMRSQTDSIQVFGAQQSERD